MHSQRLLLSTLAGSSPGGLAVSGPSLGVIELLVSAIAFLGGLFAIKHGFDSYRIGAIVRNTATETAQSVAMGRTALQGRARSLGEDFDQPFEEGACVYASWAIEEYTSGQDGGWNYVAAGNRSDRFLVEGETGAVAVEDPHYDDPSFPINDDALPTGAIAEGMDRAFALVELADTHQSRVRVESGEEPPPRIAEYCEEVGVSPVADCPRRYTQAVVPPRRGVYVFGQATRDERLQDGDHVDDVIVERDEGTDLFVLSDLTRDAVVSRYFTRAPLTIVVGLLLAVGGLFGLLFTLGIA